MSQRLVIDQQTGQPFEVVDERWFDVVAAWISALYSLGAIAYLAWVVLDTWSEQYQNWPGSLTGQLNVRISATIFKLIVYTAVGGGMGAAVSNLRSFVSWHAERKAFGWRFVWKYIALPPLGATLAVLVYGIIQGGMAVFNGGNVGGNGTTVTSLSAWATGTLAGYGSHKVFIWLDDKVNSLFKVDAKLTTKVPDLTGKTVDETKKALADAKLKLGTTQEQPGDQAMIGKVISQDPVADTELACDSSVNVIIGAPSDKPAPDTDKLPKNGQPAATKEEHVPAGNGQQPAPETHMVPAVGPVPAVEGAAAGAPNVKVPKDMVKIPDANTPNGEGQG